MVEFKDRLSLALATKGVRAVDLAERLGVSRSAISQYTSGKVVPKQDRLYNISQILGVSPVWLMGMDVTMDGKAIPTTTTTKSEPTDLLARGKKLTMTTERNDNHKQKSLLDIVFADDPDMLSRISNVTTKGEFIYEDAVRKLTPEQIKILHDGFKKLIDEAVVNGQTEIIVSTKEGGE